MSIDLTKLSRKGQVVIPNTIRKTLGLKEGAKFLVVGIGDTILLRRLELSKEKMKLKRFLQESRKKAKKVGFTAAEIERFIRDTRKVS